MTYQPIQHLPGLNNRAKHALAYSPIDTIAQLIAMTPSFTPSGHTFPKAQGRSASCALFCPQNKGNPWLRAVISGCKRGSM